MKNLKKMLSFVLAIVLVFGANLTTAFAAEPGDTVTEPVRHTIEVVVEPGEEAGIMPLMWGQFTPAIVADYVYNTDSFYVSERYFAYECKANDLNGNSVNGSYTVSLMKSSARIASISRPANGETYKLDWLDIGSGTYYFKITNSTNVDLNFTITYYSWT